MQVALECGPDVTAAEILYRLPQFDESLRLTSGPRLRNHLRGLGSDAWQRLPAVGGTVAFSLSLGKFLDDVGGIAVGHHAPRVFARPVFVVGNLAQGDHRVHDFQSARSARPPRRIPSA